jgi:hypothetical protein
VFDPETGLSIFDGEPGGARAATAPSGTADQVEEKRTE